MQVCEAMTRNVAVVSPDDSVREAAFRMDQLNIGALPVCDGERLVGIITDRDIVVRSTAAGLPPANTPVHDVMSDDVRWCFEDDDVEEAERAMEQMQIRRLPVVDHDKRLVGMLSLGDLATGRVPGSGDTLRAVSEPSEPNRSSSRLAALGLRRVRYREPSEADDWYE